MAPFLLQRGSGAKPGVGLRGSHGLNHGRPEASKAAAQQAAVRIRRHRPGVRWPGPARPLRLPAKGGRSGPRCEVHRGAAAAWARRRRAEPQDSRDAPGWWRRFERAARVQVALRSVAARAAHSIAPRSAHPAMPVVGLGRAARARRGHRRHDLPCDPQPEPVGAPPGCAAARGRPTARRVRPRLGDEIGQLYESRRATARQPREGRCDDAVPGRRRRRRRQPVLGAPAAARDPAGGRGAASPAHVGLSQRPVRALDTDGLLATAGREREGRRERARTGERDRAVPATIQEHTAHTVRPPACMDRRPSWCGRSWLLSGPLGRHLRA